MRLAIVGVLLMIGLIMMSPGARALTHVTHTNEKVAKGVWGGPHIIMEVTDSGATITYDCAIGTIDQQLSLDTKGRFYVRGTHTKQHGGPARSDEKPDRHVARYTGRVEGNRMTLVLELPDTKEKVGTFYLTFGEQPELTRCL